MKARLHVGILPVVAAVWWMPTRAEAKRDKPPPPPEAWTYTISGTRSVSTTATGAGAAAMPKGLSGTSEASMAWTATAGLSTQHPDGSITELLRIDAPGSAMHERAFGLRRFDDGEVLRVERLLDLADTGLAAWDPILGAISPARPEIVTLKRPGNRALQWTARLGTAQFLRTNCPAIWTLIEDDGAGVEGWQGRAVEHLRYEGTCGMSGRADPEHGSGPVPLRGDGQVSGEVWWDAGTHQVLRHDLVLERTVRSRWAASSGRVEVIQEQTYSVRVDWSPAPARPREITPLATETLVAALPSLLEAWTACVAEPGARELVVAAGPDGRLEVRTARAPVEPAIPSTSMLATALPGTDAVARGGEEDLSVGALACWQAAADSVKLSVHDDIGVEFTFVLPWRQAGFGLPGIVERARPPLGPLFVVADEADAESVVQWLGVRQ